MGRSMKQPAKQGGPRKRFLASGLVVSAMTLISRVFGLARDMVIAYFFGAGSGADAFFLAFRIPNFFRRLFAEGAFSQAFVPVLSEYRKHNSKQEVQDLIDRTAGTLGLALLLITVLGVAGAELLLSAFAAGYLYHNEVEKFALATNMLRLTFPYLLLISMTAFAGAILNTFGRFAVPAFTPVLLNLSLILCALLLRPYFAAPALALAWGVLIAGVVQLTFQLPFLASEGLLPRPKVNRRANKDHPGVAKIMLLMLPALFGVSVSQINLLVDTLLASFLETGSLSWLYYADRLVELPLALFGIAVATVILPGLSAEHASRDRQGFSDTLNWALRIMLLFGLPASVALLLLADALIATLFYQGEMTPRDVTMAGLALAAYGVGLIAHMYIKALAPGYFARQDTKTPVRYGLVALVSNILLNLALVWHLQHLGLALATSISAFINAGLLYFGLRRALVLMPAPGWAPFICRVLAAAAVMGALLIYFTPPLSLWLQLDFWMRLALMLLICAGGAVAYAAVLAFSGMNFRKLVR